MEKKDPRKMALQIAGLRMGETYLPEDERVFQDPYAEYFFPPEARDTAKNAKWIKSERAKYEAVMPGVNGAIAARIRYMDECVSEAAHSGFRQLVIIGAGYDTRAYRIEGVEAALCVFEVDHPLTQEVKTRTIEGIFGGLPTHVTYVPVVFGEDRLGEKLLQHGYDPKRKTLFIAEGLLMYIPPPAVDALLDFIRNASAKGSAVVADIFDTTVVDGTSTLPEAQVLKSFVEKEGAPLQFGIPTGAIEDFFRKRGFRKVRSVDPSWCRERFFTGASRSRRVTPMFQFVYAVV